MECQLRIQGQSEKGAGHDGKGRRSGRQDAEPDLGPPIPTAVDLAASFLQAEPSQEKEELEAALISETHDLAASTVSSDDDESEATEGTGAALSLPAFMATFLQGIFDRLQVKVHGIVVSADMELPSEATRLSPTNPSDCVTFQFRVEDVDIEGVTHVTASASTESRTDHPKRKEGKRLISLGNIRGSLISDATLFANLARSSALSSPAATHSNILEERKPPTKSTSTTSFRGLRTFDGASSPEAASTASSRALSSSSSPLTGILGLSRASINASDDGKVEDADVKHGQLNLTNSASRDDRKNLDNSISDDRAYSIQASDSQYLEHNEFGSGLGGHHHRRPPPISRLSSSSTQASTHWSPVPRQTAPHSSQPAARAEGREGSSSGQMPSRPTILDRRPWQFQAPETAASQHGHGKPQSGHALEDDTNSSTPSDDENRGPSLAREEDLAQSQLFSHEYAESMYMSAISHDSEAVRVPGGWDHSSDDSNEPALSRRPSSSRASKINDPLDNLEHARHFHPSQQVPIDHNPRRSTNNASDKQEPSPNAAQRIAGSGRSIPSVSHASSRLSERSTTSSDGDACVTKHVLDLNRLYLYLPGSHTQPAMGPEEIAYGSSTFLDVRRDTTQSTSLDVPGAFSAHLPPKQTGSIDPAPSHPDRKTSPTKLVDPSIEVVVGSLSAHADFGIGKLIVKMLKLLKNAFPSKVNTQVPDPKSKSTRPDLKISTELISIKLLEKLSNAPNDGISRWKEPADVDVLLRAYLKDCSVSALSSPASTKITLGKFRFGYANEDILSFDTRLQMRASMRDLKAAAGIDCSISISRSAGSIRCEVTTLPLYVSLDLQRLDEVFSWFGGLSSVLSLGGSVASNTTITTHSPARSRNRGVRFAAPIRPEDTSIVTQNKADIRLGGLVLDLVGSECSIGVMTSAVKVVGRDEGIGIGINTIKLSGPHLKRSDDDPAIVVEVNSMRIEYLATPVDNDLDRLLSLITPSKSRYDQDDDILIDTLLRQRKQGPVLRLTVDEIQTRIAKLHELIYLPELLEEASRLSTVAKYLPDDDRPGLLSLIEVHTFGSNVEVNREMGAVEVIAKEIQIAQITLPALIALSVDTISAQRNGSEVLLEMAPATESGELGSRSPCIMARMIGDEMEPVIKVKLCYIQVEYRVPTLIALLGLRDKVSGRDVSAGLTASVATLTDFARTTVQREAGQEKPENPALKRMRIDVVFRDCILGLNPQHASSKVLVVLTESHLVAALPKEQHAKVIAELSKASLLAIDDVANIGAESPPTRNRQSFDGGSSQVAILCSSGFVSVSYISSAKAIIRLIKDEDGEPSVDVELRDDLFVLESCADSTQTLIATLNGLVPPTPSNKETKYRTKVIPVTDLLASLSGDAFGTAEGDYDFDEDFGIDQALSESGDPEGEGPDDFNFDSNYYQHDPADLYEEIEEVKDDTRSEASLPVTLHDTSDGVLLESLAEQPEVDPNEELEFNEEYFGTGSVLEGTAHRWNSAKNTYDKSNIAKVRHSPLKVCIRDVHIIWNLFDGYDWQSTRNAISKAVQDVETKATEKRARNEKRPTFDQDIEDEETVIGDFLFNSIYIGIPANRDPRELAATINQELNDNATETESVATTSLSTAPSRPGSTRRAKPKKLRLHRSKDHKITFELKGVSVDLVAFPPGSGETQSSIDVRIHDFEIFDHVPTSTWRKFATYMHDAGERETGSSMIHIEILNVKPVPELAASEIVLKATVLPLRLHVDQDALDFITRFFEFKSESAIAEVSPGDVPFLQRVEVNSVQVKLDFKPKRIDYAGLRSGHTTEFMNFVILDEADMVLRHTIIYGISGFDKLGKTLNDIWMPDIKRNQLPGILAGLAPVRSLVNVGGGFRHLVVVPMHEYKKDGRIVRGISKGAAKFAKTTGTELVKLGAKVAIGVQTVLQGAEGFLAQPPGSSPVPDDEADEEEKKQISPYANQPVGVFQGLRGGYTGLQRDLVLARDAIIAVPGEVMEEGTAAGVLKAVRKHAPTVILRPAIGVAKAGGQILMGATNSMDPGNLRRVDAVSSSSFPPSSDMNVTSFAT